MRDNKPLPGEDGPDLRAIDKETWWDVVRKLKPDMTRKQFEADYAEMQEAKRRHFEVN